MNTAHLHVLGAPERRCPVGDGVTVIGREDPPGFGGLPVAVSRRHCEIRSGVHGFSVCDLGSTNGSHLNGEPLGTEQRPLSNGDQLVLAGAVTLRFVDLGATPYAPRIGRLSGVWIDPETAAVWVDAQLVEPPLSDRQLALVRLLASREGEVVPRNEVVDTVWADVAADGVSAQALDALVKRTRARLRPWQLGEDYLENHRGRGLRLAAPGQVR